MADAHLVLEGSHARRHPEVFHGVLPLRGLEPPARYAIFPNNGAGTLHGDDLMPRGAAHPTNPPEVVRQGCRPRDPNGQLCAGDRLLHAMLRHAGKQQPRTAVDRLHDLEVRYQSPLHVVQQKPHGLHQLPRGYHVRCPLPLPASTGTASAACAAPAGPHNACTPSSRGRTSPPASRRPTPVSA